MQRLRVSIVLGCMGSLVKGGVLEGRGDSERVSEGGCWGSVGLWGGP